MKDETIQTREIKDMNKQSLEAFQCAGGISLQKRWTVFDSKLNADDWAGTVAGVGPGLSGFSAGDRVTAKSFRYIEKGIQA